MTDRIGITLNIYPEEQVQSHAVIERLAAVVTGFAMEGIICNLQVTPFDLEEEA